MSEMTKTPTHYRLLTAMKAIGPYLREGQSKEGYYLFDCLSACVNDQKSPEKREFWGWWLELERTEEGFEAKYHIGRYNTAGVWGYEALPAHAVSEVTRTQEDFHQKLVSHLIRQFDLSVVLHEESVEFV